MHGLGSKQCSGTGYQTCETKSNGCTDWSSVVPCGSNEYCSSGTCVVRCVNQCTLGAIQCSGSAYQTCELKANGCTDWGSSVSCGANQSCKNNACGCSWVSCAGTCCGVGEICQNGSCVTGPTPVWKVLTPITANNLTAIWGSAWNDIWAVGDSGAIVHYNGKGWQLAGTNVTTKSLYSVFVVSPVDLWVVGEDGTILHYAP